MKPIIIYVDSEKDEIKLSRKQFEKFIQDAYQQGYDSGYAEGNKRYYLGPYVYTTATNQLPSITYTTGTDPNTYKPSITCTSLNDNTGKITLDMYNNGSIGSEVHNTIGD